jgi:hypothetical protein
VADLIRVQFHRPSSSWQKAIIGNLPSHPQ